jgi:ABC-type nitrate/sulfonate/bicarbonate transport system ATPase subunit
MRQVHHPAAGRGTAAAPLRAGSIFDVPVTEPRDEIGIVFQKPTLLPWLNVLDNITFPMRHKYGRVDEKDVASAHDLAGHGRAR